MNEPEPVTRRDHDVDGRLVRFLTLQRPEQRNPLDAATLAALHQRLREADDDGRVRAVVITGAGEAFSAGGDLRGYVDLYADPEAFRAFLEEFAAVCDLLEEGDFVSVAMVNGACVAGGLELLLACDLSVAATTARIGDGHLTFGQLPGAGGSQRLCRAVGLQVAKDLLLTGRLVDGATAATLGLVTTAVPPDDLTAVTTELAGATTRHSPLAMARMKALVRLAQEKDRPAALREEMDIVHHYATTSHDAVEGLRAFLDRRPPEWRGR